MSDTPTPPALPEAWTTAQTGEVAPPIDWQGLPASGAWLAAIGGGIGSGSAVCCSGMAGGVGAVARDPAVAGIGRGAAAAASAGHADSHPRVRPGC